MGEPVKPPEDFGPDCLDCFPTGKAPEIIRCVFHGIVLCPGFTAPDPPNDYIFRLHNTDVCRWECGPPDYDWLIDYYMRSAASLNASHKDGPVLFRAQPTPPESCTKSFTNSFACPDNYYGGGTAHLWWLTDPIPEILCETMSFSPGDGNLSHKTPTIENMADYRIANRRDKTNVLIRVDTSVISPP